MAFFGSRITTSIFIAGFCFAILIAIYLLITDQLEYFDVSSFLLQVYPYYWASLGIGACLGLSVLGAAW